VLFENKIGGGDSAIVIAAGPSLKRHNGGEQIQAANYQGSIIATESAMLYCLKQGIVPDLVVTVDPHESRIVRWFGDPELTLEHLGKDDYFARQDMDDSFSDQIQANQEVYDLVNQYGPKIKIALSTSASDAVVSRALESGMDIYWWNPIYDEPSSVDSITRKLFEMNGFPCLNAGGNVGSACWMMADTILEKKKIAVVGMDFGYYSDLPYSNTQYYNEIIDLVGEENLDSVFMHIYNPYLDKWFYTDPAYMWYRDIFLEMIGNNTESQTFNCTEGGVLFGNGLGFIPLDEFLNNTSDNQN